MTLIEFVNEVGATVCGISIFYLAAWVCDRVGVWWDGPSRTTHARHVPVKGDKHSPIAGAATIGDRCLFIDERVMTLRTYALKLAKDGVDPATWEPIDGMTAGEADKVRGFIRQHIERDRQELAKFAAHP